jgi:hypothetical protein
MLFSIQKQKEEKINLLAMKSKKTITLGAGMITYNWTNDPETLSCYFLCGAYLREDQLLLFLHLLSVLLCLHELPADL